jgi:hypothetical protein
VILAELNRFQQGIAPTDDTTLVIIKVTGQMSEDRNQK